MAILRGAKVRPAFLMLLLLWATSLQAQVASPSFSSLRFPVNPALYAATINPKAPLSLTIANSQHPGYELNEQNQLVDGFQNSFRYLVFRPKTQDKPAPLVAYYQKDLGLIEILPMSDTFVFGGALKLPFPETTDLTWDLIFPPRKSPMQPKAPKYTSNYILVSSDMKYIRKDFKYQGMPDFHFGVGVAFPVWGHYWGYYLPGITSFLDSTQLFYAVGGVYWKFLRWEYGRQNQSFYYPNEADYAREGWYKELEIKLWRVVLGYKESNFNDSGANLGSNQIITRQFVGWEPSQEGGLMLLGQVVKNPAQPQKDFASLGLGWQF